jgi:hypothetical protein
MTGAVLGHPGGWDETLLVLLPIALFAGLLAIANRRASRQLAADDEAAETSSATPSDPE